MPYYAIPDEKMADVVGVDAITDLQGASRSARSYAFLYAAFKGASTTQSTIRDVVDCLTPFIVAYTNSIPGRQVELGKVQEFLRNTFGFDIPLYALEQIIPSLRAHGYIQYKPGAKIYTAVAKSDSFSVAREEIETDFGQIADLLQSYAKEIGFAGAPPSGSWEEAIIRFLKPDDVAPRPKFISVHNVLLDPRDIESRIVATFIQKIGQTQIDLYNKIVKIFMGILVEDFLSGVSEVGEIDRRYPLVIFYDTTVLLRCLGCSGRLLRTASDELTLYLQDIGCKIHFLPGNEAEVNGVLSTIVNVKDSGGELEGETADGISRGEVLFDDIRMLCNSFVQNLARQNIFEFQHDTLAAGSTKYQINERAFSKVLLDKSQLRGRGYGQQNRDNDAGFLGTVMRLRGDTRARDFADSKYVFVTANRFLANASREFLVQQKQLTRTQCPPILHVTQVATIAWLLKDQKISPDIAARELLINCYAAARPDAEWFRSFREGIQKVVGDFEAFGRNPDNGLVLQAARRIAQEQSFSNAAIMRELNAAEIIDLSRREAERIRQELTDRHAAEKQQQAEEHEKEQRETEESHQATISRMSQEYQSELSDRERRASAAAAARSALDENINTWSMTYARRVVFAFQAVLALAFILALFADSLGIVGENSGIALSIKIILGTIGAVHFLDLIGVKIVSRKFDLWRENIATRRKRTLSNRLITLDVNEGEERQEPQFRV